MKTNYRDQGRITFLAPDAFLRDPAAARAFDAKVSQLADKVMDKQLALS